MTNTTFELPPLINPKDGKPVKEQVDFKARAIAIMRTRRLLKEGKKVLPEDVEMVLSGKRIPNGNPTALPRKLQKKIMPMVVNKDGDEQFVFTIRMQNLCHEFMKDFNVAAAGKRVGYSKAQLGVVMARREVRDYILQLTEERRLRFEELELPDVINELKKMGFANVSDYVRVGQDGVARMIPFDFLSEEQRQGISKLVMGADGKVSMEVNKLEPLVKLGQHFGAFPTRVEFNGRMLIGNIDLTNKSAEELARIAKDPRSAISGA